MKNFEIKNQNGRSMIEMLGVLAIIGVLSVGGIAGYSKAMTKYRINKTIEQITLIAGNVRTFFGPQRNYSGLDAYDENKGGYYVIKKAKLIPDEMWDGNDIKHVWGGEFYLSSLSKSTGDDYQAFKIELRFLIPEEACIEIVSQDWSASGVKGIGIMNGSENWTYLKAPAEMNDAITACTDADFIEFYFDIDLSSSLWSSTFN